MAALCSSSKNAVQLLSLVLAVLEAERGADGLDGWDLGAGTGQASGEALIPYLFPLRPSGGRLCNMNCQ